MRFRRRPVRSRGLVAALSLIVPMLLGPLLVGAPSAQADVDRAQHAREAGLNPPNPSHPPHPPYPPYPPANCLRHHETPVRHGWRVDLFWIGGPSCPRIFFRPAKAEIWMYAGIGAPLGGPWTNGEPVEPAARYGGVDSAVPAADAANPAATWWEKVKTVRVDRDGAWSAEILVRRAGPYTFAAVNSISRAYVLIEVEVGAETPADGTAGGAGTAAGAGGPADGSDGTRDDPLRRVGVPAASSAALVIGLVLGIGLLRRTRGRRREA